MSNDIKYAIEIFNDFELLPSCSEGEKKAVNTALAVLRTFEWLKQEEPEAIYSTYKRDAVERNCFRRIIQDKFESFNKKM